MIGRVTKSVQYANETSDLLLYCINDLFVRLFVCVCKISAIITVILFMIAFVCVLF